MTAPWSEGQHEFGWMYKTKRWQHIRSSVLRDHPLCAVCWERGLTVVATVVHHLNAHRGRWHLFVDPDNLQAVCKPCHDGELQFVERRGYSNSIGDEGWPMDSNHPVNKG